MLAARVCGCEANAKARAAKALELKVIASVGADERVKTYLRGLRELRDRGTEFLLRPLATADALRTRSQAGSSPRFSQQFRAYCARVVRSSIKIPTEISHSPGILTPRGYATRRDATWAGRGTRAAVVVGLAALYDMLTLQNFSGLFFSRCNFSGRGVRITWKRARGLTANDKANVILSALREISRSQTGAL